MAGDHDLIDFVDLAAALLDRAEQLVPQWLPGGKVVGPEWVCPGFSGGSPRSLSVNLKTGRWADFAGEDKGGDLISLYAAIHGLNNGQAARQIIKDMGWEKVRASSLPQRNAQTPATAGPPDDRPDEPPADDKPAERRKSLWRAVVPVPAMAPEPTFSHFSRGKPDHTWCYEFEGQRYGYVARFRTSDGGKEILPHTWCVDESDGRGTMSWRWMQWEEPRPLYVPATLLSGDPATVPVVLVEGEKCAMAGHQLLGHEFDFVSWPGGGKAWAKAHWGWLMGRTVYLWPDCDAKRVALNKAERDEGVDPLSKPIKPALLQPGLQAMVGIGSMLVADQGCTVFMCPIPEPGAVSDGWDIADAIEQGWDAATVRAFIRGARAFEPPDDAARARSAGLSTPSTAGAATDDAGQGWRSWLLKSAQGSIKAVRENVVLALDGVPERGVPGLPECAGVIAFNEFTNDVVKLKPSPWGTPQGVWDEVDDLLMGEWLTREHWLPSMPRGTLEEAVRMVAFRRRYHPVREWLETVRPVWDKVPRLRGWVRQCCMHADELGNDLQLEDYLARVGTWLVMAICARVLTPGVKFDYMTIFEGGQGVGKSTLASLLGGAWFADTGLVLGDKDSFQNLQGVLVYEWGELDALNKSEITKVKSFISSPKDRFRASFDRRSKDYPRQVVFVGTTNERHYLNDPTGNRRFWPVTVTRETVDLAWFRAHRDQLFSEALHYLAAGERFHPTFKEQRALFDPQQNERAVDNAIESAICRYLHPANTESGPGADGLLVNETTLVALLGKLGIGIEKLGPARFHEKQAASALRRLGWTEARSSAPGRPRIFKRPAEGAQPARGSESITTNQGATSDCPF